MVDSIEVWTRHRHLLWDDHADGYEVANAGDALAAELARLRVAFALRVDAAMEFLDALEAAARERKRTGGPSDKSVELSMRASAAKERLRAALVTLPASTASPEGAS